MTRLALAATACLLVAGTASAQSPLLKTYANSQTALDEAAAVARKTPAQRTAIEIQGLLPHRVPERYVNFVLASRRRGFLDAVDGLRLNEMLTSPPGTGGTSLLSRVAAPAVLGAAFEYGGILQRTSGRVTTLRGNALGIGRLLLGSEQFPYCPEIDPSACRTKARLLRTVSGVVALEDTRRRTEASASSPTPAQLLSDDYRVASWGLRVNVTPSTDLDDPKYVRAWSAAIGTLRTDASSRALTQAVTDFAALTSDVYADWMQETVGLLSQAPSERAFYQVFEARLALLTDLLAARDPQFLINVTSLSRAFENYVQVRDELIRTAHVHKLSAEITNRRPLDAPRLWNARVVYSHQPTAAPTLVTANLGVTWYDQQGPSGERWRDLQLAGQIDRRLGQVPRFGHAILTLALYYQWMRDDALITIPAGTLAPGTSIVLPKEASALLGTKGHIVVFQSQLSIPVNDTVKMPLSVTWANRSELIKEKDVRGQLGLTIELDSLFH